MLGLIIYIMVQIRMEYKILKKASMFCNIKISFIENI